MKKVIFFFFGCLLSILLFLVISYFSLPLASPAYQNYFLLKDYINQTAPKHKKRLVIMSASDGMFGIVGELIDKETEYFPINYSIFFGTGLDLEFRINKLISVLKDGDTLLLPLNYGFYTTQSNPQYFSYFQNMLSWGDDKFLYNHPILSLQTLLKSPPSKIPTGILQHITTQIRKTSVLNKALTRWKENKHNFYGISTDSLDKYGTLRYQQGTKISSDLTFSYIEKDSSPTKYFLQFYNQLKTFCNQRNIQIIVTYPPMLKNSEFNLDNQKTKDILKNFRKRLEQEGITIVGLPQNFQFSLQDFYDTPNHLNTQGAIKYTKELIKILNQSRL